MSEVQEGQVWDKREDEPEKAYNLFLEFADIPVYCRSVRELHRRQFKTDQDRARQTPATDWYKWKKEFDWDSRARALHLHTLLVERAGLVDKQRSRLEERLQVIDKKVDLVLGAIDKDSVAGWITSSPATVSSLLKTLTELRSKTEQEILGVNTLQVQENPRDPTEAEEAEVAALIAGLESRAKDGDAAAAKLLLRLNGVKL